jgi:hypothetical protein
MEDSRLTGVLAELMASGLLTGGSVPRLVEAWLKVALEPCGLTARGGVGIDLAVPVGTARRFKDKSETFCNPRPECERSEPKLLLDTFRLCSLPATCS